MRTLHSNKYHDLHYQYKLLHVLHSLYCSFYTTSLSNLLASPREVPASSRFKYKLITLGAITCAFQLYIATSTRAMYIKKSKGKFLYRAVSNPYDCSKCFLHFTPWQTCSIEHHLGFSGKHSATQQFHEDCSYTNIHQYHGIKKTCPRFYMAVQDLNPGPLSRESNDLPLSHCTTILQWLKVKTTG